MKFGSFHFQRKRGRKGQIDIEYQMSIYRDHMNDLLDENERIRPATALVYETLSTKFESKMTSKAIQLCVTKNAEKIFGRKLQREKVQDNNDDSGSDFEKDLNIISKDFFGATITVNLLDADRYSFDIVFVEGPSRTYKTLRPGWTDKLFSIVVRETDSKCCYSFNRIEMIGDEFKSKATCVECEGDLYVISSLQRTKLSIQIKEGDKPHTFSQTRRLAKSLAKDLEADLAKETSHNIHMRLVNELDENAERLPRDFPSQKSLQNLRYRMNANTDSAITELRKMTYMPQYLSTLKEVCAVPFRVRFWTAEQVYAFMQLKKRQRICLSFDATGGIISNASIQQDMKKHCENLPEIPHVFLYLICVKNDKGVSVPVGQFLSAEQDSNTISFFLNTWAKDFSKDIDEVVTDDSAALQLSIVMSFTRFRDTNEYIETCFSILEGEKVEDPELYLRMDIPHYIKNLKRDKIFEKVDKRMKQFYLSVMGVLIQCESYSAFKEIVKNVIILANYPIFGEWNGVHLPSAEAFKATNAIIQTHEVDYLVGEHSTESLIMTNETGDRSKCVYLNWFENILDKIEKDLQDYNLSSDSMAHLTQPNWYHFPQFNNFLRFHLASLPLWSAVLRNHFGSKYLTGVSSDVESRIKLFKRNVFRNISLPARPDIIVKKMIEEVNGVAKLTRLLMTDENNNTDSCTHEQPKKRKVFNLIQLML